MFQNSNSINLIKLAEKNTIISFNNKKGFQVDLEFNELPYGTNALSKIIDEETMVLHHDKHHKKYFDTLMESLKEINVKDKNVNDILENLNDIPKELREKVRNNGGGHFNHEFFWNLMSPKPKSEPTGDLKKLIDSEFGNLQKFKDQFTQTGLDRFGSGWVWLCINRGKLKITGMPYQDNPIIEKCGIPLIGCDVWEHAYYLKYKNDREKYLKSWFELLNWEFPENILKDL
jgi:Fe-Mn family superoxide dismutase